MKVTDYLYPETLEEALELLSAPDTSPIAGGTVVALEGARAPRLVDVTRLGLDEIKAEGEGILVGAAARAADLTVEALGESPEAALLAEAAAGMATTPLRHAISVGGNLVYLCNWADLPVAALALDAEVEIATAGAAPERRAAVAWAEKHPRAALPKDALVTGLFVPTKPGKRAGAYGRFRMTETENALVTVAVMLTVEGGSCTEARVAIGAVSPRPARVEAVEAALVGGPLTPARIAAAVEALEVKIAPNFRMTQKHRARVLKVTARRTIEAAVARLGGEN